MRSLIQIALALTLLLAAGCSTIQSVTATALDPMETDIPIEVGDTLTLEMKNQTEFKIAVTDIDETNISGRVITVSTEDEGPQLLVIPRDEIETIIKTETKDEKYLYDSTVQKALGPIDAVMYFLAAILGMAIMLGAL